MEGFMLGNYQALCQVPGDRPLMERKTLFYFGFWIEGGVAVYPWKLGRFAQGPDGPSLTYSKANLFLALSVCPPSCLCHWEARQEKMS